MTSAPVTFSLLNSVRQLNDERSLSNREYIGGLYFLVAVGMVEYTLGIGIIQAYVLPLGLLRRFWTGFENGKVVALIYIVILSAFYFLISTAGGMTGFIVAGAILTTWTIALLVVGIIRRCLASTEEENANQVSAATSQPESPKPSAEDSQLPPTGDSGTFEAIEARPPPTEEKDEPWTSAPDAVTRSQMVAFCMSVTSLLVTLLVMVIIIFAWKVPEYALVTQQDTQFFENSPQLTTKGIQFMYAYPEVATNLQLGIYVKLLTEWCGKEYHKILSESEKTEIIKEDFIEQYKVNMSLYILSDYRNYTTVNDWFIRKIDLKYRPLPQLAKVITAPADARTLVFSTIAESTQWFKGVELNHRELIGQTAVDGRIDYFDGGSMVISRLAPEDYHRFHAPINGTVVSYTELPGTYWSVGVDAARSGNNVLLNLRKVLIIDAGGSVGKIAFVAVGATCVGSVLIEDEHGHPIRNGTFLQQGQQLGIMQFGGSTVVMLFRAGPVTLDPALLYRSAFPVETFVETNSQIGIFQ